MKYIILRASCMFSNGSRANIVYDEDNVTEENSCNDEDNVTEENSCNDIEVFRSMLRDKLNSNMDIIGVYVTQIHLTYEERDSRQ